MRTLLKKQGTFKLSGKGYGFITPDEESENDWFVPARYTETAWTGDHVEYVEESDGYRPFAQVTKILERAVTETVAIISDTDVYGNWILTPLGRGIPSLVMDAVEWDDAKAGDIAKVKITQYIDGVWEEEPNCSLVKKLGHQNDPGADILAVAENAGISNDFPEEVLKEAKNLPTQVTEKEKKGKVRGLHPAKYSGCFF